MLRDQLDFTDIRAEARAHAITFPNTAAHRMELMHHIARRLQQKQGHFYYDQVYDLLEQAYGDPVKRQIQPTLEALDQWLKNDPEVEYLGKESGFAAYRMRNV